MRSLHLKKETLSDLTPEELSAVVGAAADIPITKAPCISGIVQCIPTDRCPTETLLSC